MLELKFINYSCQGNFANHTKLKKSFVTISQGHSVKLWSFCDITFSHYCLINPTSFVLYRKFLVRWLSLESKLLISTKSIQTNSIYIPRSFRWLTLKLFCSIIALLLTIQLSVASFLIGNFWPDDYYWHPNFSYHTKLK